MINNSLDEYAGWAESFALPLFQTVVARVSHLEQKIILCHGEDFRNTLSNVFLELRRML